MRTLLGSRFGVSQVDWAIRLFWIAVWMMFLAFLAPRFVVGDDALRESGEPEFDAAYSKEAEEREVPLLPYFHADW